MHAPSSVPLLLPSLPVLYVNKHLPKSIPLTIICAYTREKNHSRVMLMAAQNAFLNELDSEIISSRIYPRKKDRLPVLTVQSVAHKRNIYKPTCAYTRDKNHLPVKNVANFLPTILALKTTSEYIQEKSHLRVKSAEKVLRKKAHSIFTCERIPGKSHTTAVSVVRVLHKSTRQQSMKRVSTKRSKRY